MKQPPKHPWIQKVTTLYQHHGLPLLVGIIATIAVFGLWQQLLVQENLHIEHLVEQETSAIEIELNQELSTRILALQRMSDRWQLSGGTPQVLWEADATNYVAHFPGHQAIERVDPSFHVRWIVPLQGNEAAKNLDLNQDFNRQITLSLARNLRQTLLTPTVTLAQGGKGFLVCIPLFVDVGGDVSQADRFDGFLVGVFQFQTLLDNILTSTTPYRIQIYDGTELVYSRGEKPSSASPKTAWVRAFGADWQMQVFPTATLIGEARSPLPIVVLGSGLVTGWILALAVYLAQRSKRYAWRAKTMNQQLQSEIIYRQRIETSLRKSEERLQLALEASAEGWWDWDMTTGKVDRSSQYLKLLGYEPGEFPEVVDSWKSSIHPDDLSQVIEQLTLHLNDGSVPYACDYRVQTKSGSWQWISDYGKVVARDVENKPLRMIGTFKDISARKEAEAALKQSEAILRSFFNSGTMLMGIVELHEHDILHLSDNQAAADFFGTTPDAMQNRFASDMGIPQQHLQHWIDRYREAEQTQSTVRFEYSHNAPSGQRWLTASVCQISNNASHRPRFSYVVEDITQRKQAEVELREMTEVMENALSGISRLDSQGRYLYVNKTYAAITGYQPEEMVGMNWHQTVHPDESEKMVAVYDQMVQTGRVEVETKGTRKDGATLYKQLVMIASYDEQNRFLGHYCFMKDISERAQLETDRQQAEQALRESEARFQAFMNHSPTAAWITDTQGTMLYASQTYLRIFELPTPDLIGKSIFELYPTDIAQRFLDSIQTVAKTQEVLQSIEIAPQQGGEIGDFLVYKFPIPHSSGQTLVGGVAIDVTQQHRAEEALRQSEATKQAIIQAIPDLLIRMQADGSYVEFLSNSKFNIVNPEKYRHDITVQDVLPSDLAQLRLLYTQQALESGTPQIYEHEILIAEKQCYEEVRVVPLLKDEVLVMVRDITDRKQAEQDLWHQKEMFQAIVDHIPIMIALFDHQGQIELVNPELEQRLGWSIDDWHQRDILAEAYPDPVSYQSVLDHMLAATGYWRDFTTLAANQQPLETSWANVPLSNGHSLGIGQDISDRKHKEIALRQAVEAAEAANLAKSMFLANMSHELRTPLNVILGFAQVMTHDPLLTPSQREDLETIRRSGDHLLGLINDVLDLSKIESGHCTVERTGFDLIALLHSLRTMLSERATSKEIRLYFDIAPNVPQFVLADAPKLRQILLNLLSNGIKFTKAGSVTLQVSVSEGEKTWSDSTADWQSQPMEFASEFTSRPPITLQFAVSDTGLGIQPEEIDTIFDAFVQAEAGRKSASGTGLGLTISHKLLELMDGDIAVVSTPGQGSTFTFTLPIYPTSGVNIQSDQTDRLVVGLVPGQSHRRILVVDDQLENRGLIVRLLTQLGVEVREAANGQEAVQIWQEWHPDLTWMDIRMPELDGYEATKQIRALEQETASIIIALTAQASQSDRTLALAAGCNDYISKPFREATLFLKMAEYLGLEYLYAESKSSVQASNPPETAFANPGVNLSESKPLPLPDLSTLPKAWLIELEEATVCGNDRAIGELAKQLSPEFTQFAAHLTQMAQQYQFEQILKLIH